MKHEGNPYFGDIHNHCGISYAHGTLDDALSNARERLDFCSVTGHAHWCDMPAPNDRIAHIIEFHRKGFEKLRNGWNEVLEKMRRAHQPGTFLTFPGFEVHSNADGDRVVVFREHNAPLLSPASIGELESHIRSLAARGIEALSLPHHIGYRRGARGINWDTFSESTSPLVEVFSMHGASEHSEGPIPYRHSMGPADWESTVQYGLQLGHVFGFSANTDHHSAHPGSYGQGMTAVWADRLDSEAIWGGIRDRRTVALTGDRMAVDYEIDGAPMGAVRAAGRFAGIRATVTGGAAIDYADFVQAGHLLKRISPGDGAIQRRAGETVAGTIASLVHLEVGWGPRGVRQRWEAEFGVTEGEITSVEPRFRGPDVLSPLQHDDASQEPSSYYSKCERIDSKSTRFSTVTYGNPTNTTSAMQGVCLHVNVPRTAKIRVRLNGTYAEVPVQRLLAGSVAGYLIDEPDSPAWFLHRMPEPPEFMWDIDLPELRGDLSPGRPVYLRVRQLNGQWAWASPVFAR